MSKSEKEMKKLRTQRKGKILSALRKITYSWKPINEAQERVKVAPATFECSSCGKWCYTGKSDKNLNKLQLEHPDKNIEMIGICRDHIDPVIPLVKGWEWSWDEIIERMLCLEVDKIQILCRMCHDEKTKKENQLRKELRKK